jgi:eukaryotic-like serine/threonine-protein kinase
MLASITPGDMTERTKESLESYAKRHAPLSREEVVQVVMQIGDALHTAHSAGAVHGDLKPENITYDPESHRVELPSFGVAGAHAAAGEQQLTRGGFIIGSLLYVAPETLGGESVTPAADQYSLATIAYFLLTGRLPYLAKTPREMFHAVAVTAPIPLNRARSDVQFEPHVEAVIMRGLAKQQQDRYPSVLTFVTELRRALLP